MLFGMVSGVGRGMGVLDGVGDHQGVRSSFGLNLWRPIVTNGDGDTLFPNYIWKDLLVLSVRQCVVWPSGTGNSVHATYYSAHTISLSLSTIYPYW